jgi:hypothetical protein
MRLLALIALVLSVGCGRAHLFYDAREIQHPAFKKGDKRALVQQVGKKVGSRAVFVEGDGDARRVTALGQLGVPELSALFLVTSLNDRGCCSSSYGGENDIRVHVGRGRHPVTVYTDLEGNLRVRRGPIPARSAPAPTEGEIASRFRLKRGLPGKWDARERLSLAESLSLLSVEELRAVQGVSFIRKAKPPDGDHRRAALYTANGCYASITLFSTGVRADTYRFVGDVDNPKSATLHSIVHEIGHAVEAADARQRYCAAEGKSVARANPLISEGNRLLSGDNPMLRAYEAALAGEPAPTDYGKTSIRESFAESFALFHVDPAALQRTRPRVYAWFKRGGHLKARVPIRAR